MINSYLVQLILIVFFFVFQTQQYAFAKTTMDSERKVEYFVREKTQFTENRNVCPINGVRELQI